MRRDTSSDSALSLFTNIYIGKWERKLSQWNQCLMYSAVELQHRGDIQKDDQIRQSVLLLNALIAFKSLLPRKVHKACVLLNNPAVFVLTSEKKSNWSSSVIICSWNSFGYCLCPVYIPHCFFHIWLRNMDCASADQLHQHSNRHHLGYEQKILPHHNLGL